LLAPVKKNRVVRPCRSGIFTKTVAFITVDARVDNEGTATKPQLIAEQIAMRVCSVIVDRWRPGIDHDTFAPIFIGPQEIAGFGKSQNGVRPT
jgi:hypothetical protein